MIRTTYTALRTHLKYKMDAHRKGHVRQINREPSTHINNRQAVGRGKEEHCRLIKGSIYEEELVI